MPAKHTLTLIGFALAVLLRMNAALAAGTETFVFYLHGQIIENAGPRPMHPEWGLYDYPAIVDALSAQGATVISEVRARNTNIYEYAGITISQIEALIARGVEPSQIVVVGFSKGGIIATQVSSSLRRPEIRYALLAACINWAPRFPHLRLSGRILSVIETSDVVAHSCRSFAERGDGPVSFEEIEISTGKNHAAFYLPRDEWLQPVMRWIHNK
ncbi:MAG: alpha/beta hydrolase [Gammaproteobacteria bacterium]|nr:alpha/beta hydrolase [Gammaproteobacteria bacterium]